MGIEEMAKASLHHVQEDMRHRYQELEDRVRQCPTTSVLGAAAVGYLLHRLPLRAILVTKVRVLSALAPPVLFLYGAAKIYEYLQKQELARQE
jgi:hypothetical protein